MTNKKLVQAFLSGILNGTASNKILSIRNGKLYSYEMPIAFKDDIENTVSIVEDIDCPTHTTKCHIYATVNGAIIAGFSVRRVPLSQVKYQMLSFL
jgi:hypothetical protein